MSGLIDDLQDQMKEIERLKSIIRKLREDQFYNKNSSGTYIKTHERIWESEEQEACREECNKQNKIKWDRETEKLISGK